MNKVLEKAIQKLGWLSDAEQEQIAALLMTLTGETQEPYRLTGEERTAVEAGLDEAKRGEFVSDADMEAFWRRHRA